MTRMHPSGLQYIRLVCVVIYWAGPWSLAAQWREADFSRYTFRDGLSDDYATCLYQDAWGYIWIGTKNGLNRFDGHAFQKYYQGYPEGFLQSSVIQRIKAMSGGRIAVVTNNQVSVLQERDWTVQSIKVPDTTSFASLLNQAWDVMELPEGGLAMTTATGFYRFDQQGKLIFRHDGLHSNDVGQKAFRYARNMLKLPDGKILIYIEHNQQAIFDPEINQFFSLSGDTSKYRTLYHPSKGLPNISTTQMGPDEYIILPQADSLIYYNASNQKRIATALPFKWNQVLTWQSRAIMLDDSTVAINGGFSGFYIFYLDRSTGRMRSNGVVYFQDDFITDMLLDADHRLWVCTTTGVWKQNLRPPRIKTISCPPLIDESPSNDKKESVGLYYTGFPYRGKLYAGRYGFNYGLVILDQNTMNIQAQFDFFPGEPGWNQVMSMQMYYPDTLWIGTYNGVIWFDTRSATYGKLKDIYSDFGHGILNILAPVNMDGYAWMAGYLMGTVGRYNIARRRLEIFDAQSHPTVPFAAIKSIAYDKWGNVWFGGHSLARWNSQMQQFDTLMTSYGGPNKYNDNILTMQADPYGSLWISNVENGLLQYKIDQRQWVYYGLQEGLPSTNLGTMSPVVRDQLWVADPHHVSRINVVTGEIQSFNYYDGLETDGSESPYMIADQDFRNIYFLAEDEIAFWNFDEVQYPPSMYSLICQQIQLEGKRTVYFPEGEVDLKPDEKNLVITYNLIDHETGHESQLSYRMNDMSTWIPLSDDSKIYLSNISPGTYSLQVRARSSRGDEKIHNLRIHRPQLWWKTFWFIGGASMLFIIMGYYLYRRRIQSVRAWAALDNQLSQAEMKALLAQMNPHFIFNSLNSIRKMILQQDTLEASRYLGKFAQLIRMTLDQSRQTFITLRQTTDYLYRYVEMEKIRNPAFTCHIDVDPTLDQDEIHIPPMLVQPLIENSIWHGQSPDHPEIHIEVQFKQHGHQLVCVVDDNGMGIDARVKTGAGGSHQSVGIQNIQSRIALLRQKYKIESSLIIEDKSGWPSGRETGTRATLLLPIEIET